MKPRIKMHQMPGDILRRIKIAMLEGKYKDRVRSKAFKKLIKMRERATIKRQAQREIEKQLIETEEL